MPQTIDTGLKLAKTLLKDLKDGPDSRKHKHSKQTQESVEKTEEQPVSKRSEPANNNAPEGEDAFLDNLAFIDSEPTKGEIEEIIFNSATPDRAVKIHELEQEASSNKHLSDRIMKIVKEHGGKVKIGKRNAGKNGKTDLLDELFALVEKHAAAEGLDLTKEEIFGLLGQKLDEGLAALDTVVHKEQ